MIVANEFTPWFKSSRGPDDMHKPDDSVIDVEFTVVETKLLEVNGEDQNDQHG